ncbi:hypothetical protein IC607_10105 [Cellulomonas sp. JH27-2]|uniref:hypothetical protein n=1 Tax=Cellulomonas sp. JH27-2 TaxID=2774139 RepID=UPI00177C120F|nr:hypothetical protein [Cellulomonas sp. JH27-2]MBD8059319.1 hypothetical protein [Cellulomonas sp. JH27-2]
MGEVRAGRPLPQSVYWRRRLVVLGVPLALVVLVVWLLAGRGSADEPTAVPSTAKATTKAAKPTTTPKPSTTQTASSAVPGCASLDVGLTADDTSYAAGANVHLVATITNAGDVACLVDAGTKNATLVITSGADQVWSSADCAAASAKSKPLLLAPGEKSTTKVTWKRVRSEPGCPKNLPAPKAGTYAATYTVADENAAPAVFTLK